ncbi:hypothetical protein SO802_032393 [Lithocarpus litseifolius]|uniref:Uncharacterized protein n=1 Tax=Lithocarpus litseifolius TaxID=425828 RepID=A0AAW2BQF6_9ROSI
MSMEHSKAVRRVETGEDLVIEVQCALYLTFSESIGNVEDESELKGLIEQRFEALQSSKYLIVHQPSIHVLETPGVLVPSIPDIETELKLALAGFVKDSMVGDERIAQYLLAVLNTQGTPLHWKHLNSRRLEGIRYDSKEKHQYNLKEQKLEHINPWISQLYTQECS